jgi:Divergent InlB B-repeat domain
MRSRLWLSIAVVLITSGAGLYAAEPAAAVDWCGSEVAVDRPDTLGGNLVHIVYAVPSDGPDLFAERAAPIATDLDAVANWWRGQDETREPRFDFAAMPGCTTRFGALDITALRLSSPASDFTSPSVGTDRVLAGVGQTLDDPDKKYIVYFDSSANLDQDVCGTAFREPREGGAEASAVVWMVPNLYGFPGCGFLGNAGYVAATAAHELIHSLGALDSPGPPHPCPGDNGHPCDNPADILSPSGTSDSLFDYILDAGRDDYYAHSGSWWDVQDSVWLAHLNAPPRRVSVTVAGPAAGSSVTSSPPGVACPPRCATDFDSDMPIALSAAPADGVRFVGWAGDCSGSECAVPLGRPASITARFAAIRWLINVRVRGRGRVTSRPRGVVACPGRCRGTIAFGASARLVAVPAKGYRFVRWSGACRGSASCVVDGNATVTALFRR